MDVNEEKKQYDGTFDSLGNALNTTFVPKATSGDMEKINKEIDEFQSQKNKLIGAVQSKKIMTLEDKEFLNNETKDLIKNGKLVLEKLQNDIKIGCSPRMFEVYADLLRSIILSLKELRDLNKMILDVEMFQVDPAKDQKANVNVHLTGRELLEMINGAKATNQMNSVSTDFEIVDDTKNINMGKEDTGESF
jgi:hypothetical protein